MVAEARITKCGKCKNYKPSGGFPCPHCVAEKHKKKQEAIKKEKAA